MSSLDYTPDSQSPQDECDLSIEAKARIALFHSFMDTGKLYGFQGFSLNGDPTSVLPQVAVNGVHVKAVSWQLQAALEAVNVPPRIFVRGGQLARVRADESGRPLIDTLNESLMSYVAERAVNFVKASPKKLSREEKKTQAEEAQEIEYAKTPTAPPEAVIRDFLSQGAWPFPPLTGITEVPVIRPDGSVATNPGYDPATRLYYMPDAALSIPPVSAIPDKEELSRAIAIIEDILCDFPFVDEASKAAGWAMLFTGLIKPYTQSLSPIGIIEAPKMGTGKGLLAEIIALVATGRPALTFSAPQDDQEWKKQLTAMLTTGKTTVLIDNIEGRLEAPSLASFVTSRTWYDRVLGSNSKHIELPNTTSLLLTGNNVALGGDLPRRVFFCRLDRKVPRPWEYTQFQHPELEDYVSEHRGGILWALLTIFRSWHAAGARHGHSQTLGRFEMWCKVTSGILEHCGVKGFLENMHQVYEAMDEEGQAWEAFFEKWHAIIGDGPVTVTMLAAETSTGFDENTNVLFETLPEPLKTEAEAYHHMRNNKFKQLLGKALQLRKDTVYPGDLKLVRASDDPHLKVARWQVLKGSHHQSDTGGLRGVLRGVH